MIENQSHYFDLQIQHPFPNPQEKLVKLMKLFLNGPKIVKMLNYSLIHSGPKCLARWPVYKVKCLCSKVGPKGLIEGGRVAIPARF